MCIGVPSSSQIWFIDNNIPCKDKVQNLNKDFKKPPIQETLQYMYTLHYIYISLIKTFKKAIKSDFSELFYYAKRIFNIFF